MADFAFGTIDHVNAGVRSALAGVRGATDITSGPALGAHLGQPKAVYRTVLGDIYYLEGTSGLLRKISPTGDVRTVAGVLDGKGTIDGPGITARFFNPTAVAVGPDGAIWVGDFRSRIVRMTAQGNATTVTTLPCLPTHLAVGAANELMVACSDSTIRGVAASGATRIVASGFGAFQVSSPQTTQGPAGGALAFDGVDTLYVADVDFGSVRAMKNGAVTFFASYTEAPEGVAVSGGNIYVLVGGSHVEKRSPAGVLLQDFPLGQTLTLGSIAADATGAIYAVDTHGIRVLRLDPSGTVSVVAGGNPSTLALVPGPLPASLAAPVSVAVAPAGAPNAGAIFIADFADNSVAMIRR
jgi:sugar lactone lactonase YvrE